MEAIDTASKSKEKAKVVKAKSPPKKVKGSVNVQYNEDKQVDSYLKRCSFAETFARRHNWHFWITPYWLDLPTGLVG